MQTSHKSCRSKNSLSKIENEIILSEAFDRDITKKKLAQELSAFFFFGSVSEISAKPPDKAIWNWWSAYLNSLFWRVMPYLGKEFFFLSF